MSTNYYPSIVAYPVVIQAQAKANTTLTCMIEYMENQRDEQESIALLRVIYGQNV